MTSLPSEASTPAHDPRALLVALVDTLGAEFDAAAFLQSFVTGCVAADETTSAGLLLADRSGALELAAHSGEAARLAGRFELAHGAGPGVECYRTAQANRYPTIDDLDERWVGLADVLRPAGVMTLHTIPMTLRAETIGALTLLGGVDGGLGDEQIELARLLTEAATIGLLTQRTIRRHEDTTAQLQHALTSRILIEQAKGILAGRLVITVDKAFALLRNFARANNLRLHAVAQAVVDGDTAIPGPIGAAAGDPTAVADRL